MGPSTISFSGNSLPDKNQRHQSNPRSIENRTGSREKNKSATRNGQVKACHGPQGNPTDLEKNQKIRIFLTKYDSRKKITIDWVTNELVRYKHLLFETKIRQNEALNQAQMAQEPIFTFESRSHGAEDYKLLTKEFLNLCQLTLEKN